MATVNGSAPGEEPGRKGLHHDLQTKHSLNAEQIEACFGPVILLPVWAGHINKIPNNGQSNVSVNSPLLWKPLLEVLETQQGVAGVCLNLSGGVRLPDPDTGDIYRLVGIDVDKVTGPIELLEQLNTYTEISPSGRGGRAFCLVSEEWARQYKDNAKIELPNCDHAEIYLGSGARQLTITFEVQGISKPIRVLDDDALDVLAPLLKPADPVRHDSAPPITGGTPVDLDQYKLKPEHTKLIAGAGQPEINRSAVVHSLLIHLSEQGVSREDALATMLHEPALWQFTLDHRHDDETKAAKFAEEEVERAYRRSMKGQLEKVIEQYKPPNLIGPIAKTGAPQSDPPFRHKPLSQILADIKPPEWLIEGVLPKGFLIALLGHPNAGKTLVQLDLALRVALGLPLGKRRVVRTRVYYIAAENPEEVKWRIQLWCQENKIDPVQLDDWFVFIDEPVLFNDPMKMEKQRQEWDDLPPGLVVVDTFIANSPCEDENKASDVMTWFGNVRDYLIRPYGSAVMVLHHPPKGDDDLFNWRGSGAAAGTLDGIWAVVNRNGTVTLMQGKRRGPPFDDLHWKYQTKEIKGMQDSLGNPITSVIAKPSATTGAEVAEILICMAIENGLTSYRDIGDFAGIGKTTVGETYLPAMKKSGRGRSRLVGERGGKLYLTEAGKNLAAEGMLAGVHDFRGIVEKMQSKGG
ncbi:AAA family ATPase [Pseudogulbenkiania subflava]|uniref:AAA domain-containing protein n=1 Tax=Pseudogulbenkiania subflava DSM 22618 TaxID=1123014 RepID=A0A1Y6BHQ2_9NEIS|nr:AAA family ATPase [Pseudogulbenkiania subflava]SMF04121.1 AAA domain-containing protein [Pseudogulbenkiania subflava DSM 22618]